MFLLTFIIGLVMLVKGADYLVEGGGSLAVAFRIPAIVVGLTIVAAGTSAPELTVSVTAALAGSTALAMSNVNGSNIANIFLVLGLASLFRPLVVQKSLFERDVPTVILLQLVLLGCSLDGLFSRIDGVVVIVLGILYNLWIFYDVYQGRAAPSDDDVVATNNLAIDAVKVVGGLAVLIIGADLFVDSAVEVARRLHFSERMIGLTVVALGTSAPEAASAISAARRGEVEMAVGGSVGSNILNIAMVLGVSAVITPIDLSAGGFIQDIGMALIAGLALIPLVRAGVITRSVGMVLIAIYLAYMTYGVFASP